MLNGSEDTVIAVGHNVYTPKQLAKQIRAGQRSYKTYSGMVVSANLISSLISAAKSNIYDLERKVDQGKIMRVDTINPSDFSEFDFDF